MTTGMRLQARLTDSLAVLDSLQGEVLEYQPSQLAKTFKLSDHVKVGALRARRSSLPDGQLTSCLA